MTRSPDPRKLAAWRERFARFSSSGVTVGQFCSRERVSVASFYHWRKKLGPKGRRWSLTDGGPRIRTGLAGNRGVFRQVAVVPAASGIVPETAVLCIRLPGGARLEVGTADLDVVRTVVAEVVRAKWVGVAPGQADGGDEVRAASC
jgi:hypothetical protein